jgi:hypothetical protein
VSFDKDGYVIVGGLIDDVDLWDFKNTFEQLQAIKQGGELYDATAMLPEFLRIAFGRWLTSAVNDLLGRKRWAPLYGYMNRCLIQPPNDERRTYGWHQDVFYTVPHGRYIQVWAPLVHDTNTEHGAIELCPGSHSRGIARQAWKVEDGRNHQIVVDDDEVAKYRPVSVPLKLGQALLFDSRVIHRSGRNVSQETRYTMVGWYGDVSEPGFQVPIPRFDYRGISPIDHYKQQMTRLYGMEWHHG